MKTARHIVFACACALYLPVAMAQELPAECPERPSDEGEARKLAGNWFSRGDTLIEQNRDQEALRAYNCSLRMVEHPATLFNAAQAARLINESKSALRLLRRFIELSPKGPIADEAKSIIDELVEAQEAAQRDREAAEQSAGSAPPGQSDEIRRAEKAATLVIAGYSTLGAGAALAVVGAVLQGLAAKAAGADASSADTLNEYNDLKQKSESLQTGAIVGFAVGGAAVGAGIAMWVLGKKMEKKRESKVDLSVRPGPRGLVLLGRF